MTKIIMVILGGSLGALCRYGLASFAARYMANRFPWGTLAANLIGCFAIGAAFALTERTQALSPESRLFFMTGFLGALTTFSTYALETVQSVRTGSTLTAVLNFAANNLGGLLLVLAGMWLMQLILKGAG